MASNIDIADLAEDPTGYQFFGSYSISKYGGSTILSLLRKIQALEITAHCSLEEDSKCSSDPLNYGGIFNEGTDAIDGNPTATNSTTLNVSNIALYFCPEFFRQRPLLEQVTDATVYWDNRFNIQKYYPNQGRSLNQVSSCALLTRNSHYHSSKTYAPCPCAANLPWPHHGKMGHDARFV
jgi:hypothetical protein